MAGRPRISSEDRFYADLGRAIRLARVTAGKTQSDAADHLGVSFQQFQKYESGINRIPVEKLVTLAPFLEVPVTQLLSLPKAERAWQSFTERFQANEFHTMLESWARISDKPMRAAIIALVRRAATLSE